MTPYDKTDLQDNDDGAEETGNREMEPTNFEAGLGASQWEIQDRRKHKG